MERIVRRGGGTNNGGHGVSCQLLHKCGQEPSSAGAGGGGSVASKEAAWPRASRYCAHHGQSRCLLQERGQESSSAGAGGRSPLPTNKALGTTASAHTPRYEESIGHLSEAQDTGSEIKPS